MNLTIVTFLELANQVDKDSIFVNDVNDYMISKWGYFARSIEEWTNIVLESSSEPWWLQVATNMISYK